MSNDTLSHYFLFFFGGFAGWLFGFMDGHMSEARGKPGGGGFATFTFIVGLYFAWHYFGIWMGW